jgi:predicted Abi (CAAX) family protease
MSHPRNNYLRGLATPPTREWRSTLLITTIYVLVALGANAMFGLFQPSYNPGKHPILLALALVVFPTFLEESVFRGMLIPIDTYQKGRKAIAFHTIVSALAFTLWHPLNALTINPSARAIFCDLRFLLIVFVLGIACAMVYIRSRSLWSAIMVHWITVVVWVMFLGGRNLAAGR